MSDEFDFDNDSFDNLDFGGDEDNLAGEPSSKRGVVNKVVNQFGTGVKSNLDTDKLVEKLTDHALPKEISPSYRDTIKLKSGLSNIYHDSVKELKPELKKISREASKIIPPQFKRIKGVLERFGEETDRVGERESEQEAIKRKIADMLPALNHGEEAKKRLEEMVSHKKWTSEMEALGNISGTLKGLWTFQIERTSVYQAKSLELKYRIVLALEKTYEFHKANTDTIKKQLEAIVTNTALPEVLKIRKTERFYELVRDNTLSKLQDSMFGKGTWIDTLLTNVRERVTSFVDTAKDGLGMALMGLEMQAMNAEMGGASPTVAGAIGGFGANKATTKLAESIAKAVDKNPSLKASLGLYNTYIQNLPAKVKDYISKGDTPEFVRKAGEMFLDLTHQSSINTGLSGSYEPMAPAVYDTETRLSIVKVIPGYLKMIHGEVGALRRGGDPVYMEYDYVGNKFLTSSKLAEQIDKKLNKIHGNSNVNKRAKEFAKYIGKDKGLTKEELKIIETAAIKTAKENLSFTTETFLNTLEETNPELAEKIKTSGVFEKSEENKRNTQIAAMLHNIRNTLPDFRTVIQDYVDQGYEAYLGNLIIKDSDGSMRLNEDEYLRRITNTEYSINPDTNKKEVSSNSIASRIIAVGDMDAGQQTKYNKAIDQYGVLPLYEQGLIAFTSPGPYVDMKKLDAISARKNFGVGEDGEEVCPCEKKLDTTNTLLGLIDASLSTISTQIDNINLQGSVFTEQAVMKAGGKIKGFGKKSFDALKTLGGKAFGIGKSILKKGKDWLLSPSDFLSSLGARAASFMGRIIEQMGGISSIAATTATVLGNYLTVFKDIGKGLIGYMFRGISNIPNIASKILGTGKNYAKKARAFLFGAKDKLVDIYVGGDPNPRLLASSMRAGLYINGEDGKIIEKMSDITGPVYDLDGNLVLSMEDFNKGLRTIGGNYIEFGKGVKKGLFNKIANLYKRAFNLETKKDIKKYYQGSLDALKKKGKMAKDTAGGIVGSIKDGIAAVEVTMPGVGKLHTELKKHTEILEDIYTVVNKGKPRIGSWRNRLDKINKGPDKTIKGKAKTLSQFKKSNIDKEMLEKLASGKGVVSNLLDGVMDKAGDLAAGAGALYAGKKALGKTIGGVFGRGKDKAGKAAAEAAKVAKEAAIKGGASASKAVTESIKAGSTLAKDASKNAVRNVGKAVLKGGLKAGAKLGARAVPLASFGFAAKRAYEGDWWGAALESLAGVMSVVPGLGTAGALAIGAGLQAWDYKRESDREKEAKLPPLPDAPIGGVGSAEVEISPKEKQALGYLRLNGIKKDAIIKLNPLVRRLFLYMADEYYELTGKKIQVNSAYRSRNDQKRLARRNKNAGKGLSMHSLGYAIDINTVDANALEDLGLLRKYGFSRPIGGETWHLEPALLSMDISRAKSDPEWAMAMIAKSPGKGGGGYATVKGARKKGRNVKIATAAFGAQSLVTNKKQLATVTPITNKPMPKMPNIATPASTSVVSMSGPSLDITKPLDNIHGTLKESLDVQKQILMALNDYKDMKIKESNTKPVPPKPQTPPRTIPKPTMSMARTY